MTNIAARSSCRVCENIVVTSPALWSTELPDLYELLTEVRINGEVVDRCITRFGYRTIRFDPNDGFFLNDQPVKLLGTCNHQDHAGVGVAVPDSILEFRIRRLKEMGCNAYRCAHNPPAKELLDLCDRLGMLVIDENRNFGSSPQHLEQLAAMVKRDRNHPSIILWSICNEESIQGTPVAANIARAMLAHVKRLDPSRPVTAAVSGGILNDDCIASVMEVVGINYQPQLYDPFHSKHPNTPLLASETDCALSTRTTYQTDPEKFTFASYDEEKAFWGQTARHTWREVSRRPFVAGLFVWTGLDYRGEPSPHGWPCVSTHWGILDTCGFEKDSFFLHKAFFTREPFVHVLPHWNRPGREGQEIRVMICTNCEEVELQLNGRSLGRKRVDPIDMVEWRVPYEPGELGAIAFRGNEPVATTGVRTTGPAVALGLETHENAPKPMLADGQFAVPVTVFALDANGRRLPTANNHVTFSISGPGTILGAGNGDPTCHEPDKASARNLFRGLAQVIVQTTTEPGEIGLRAMSPGLQSAELKLTSLATSPRPGVPVAQPRYFITDWRMSPITPTRPDPNQQIADQDMNSWERIEPGRVQTAWQSARGFAVYRAVFTAPKIVQSKGGRICFDQITGSCEIYLNGSRVAVKIDDQVGTISVELAPLSGQITLSLLIESQSITAGLLGPVEIIPNEHRQPS
jgi:beta-galactosidase